MKLILVDPYAPLCAAWRQQFADPPQSLDWQYARQRQHEIGLGGDLEFRVL